MKEYKFPKLGIKTSIDTISFYMHRNWFVYYNSSKFVRSYQLRLFGIQFRIAEIDSLPKLVNMFRMSARPSEQL